MDSPVEHGSPAPMPDDPFFHLAFARQYTELQARGVLPPGDEETELRVYHVLGDGTPANPDFLVVSSDGQHFVRLSLGTRQFQSQSHMTPIAEEFSGDIGLMNPVGNVKITVNGLMQIAAGILEILGMFYPWATVLMYFIVCLQLALNLSEADNLPGHIKKSIDDLKKKIEDCCSKCPDSC